MRAIIAFFALLTCYGASAQPLLRNFFTTNGAPVNQVTAGSNVFVTFSTSGSDTRTYKIDVPALGTVSNIYVAAGTGVTITTNGSLYTFTVSTNYASTNYVNTSTNDLNTAFTNRINTATNDVATRTTNSTNDLNTLVKTYTNAVGIIQIITNASPLAMSITGNAATSGTATNVAGGTVSGNANGLTNYPVNFACWGVIASAVTSATTYFTPWAGSSGIQRQTSESVVQLPIFGGPNGVFVSNFWIYQNAAFVDNATNFLFTVRSNGASTAMAILINAITSDPRMFRDTNSGHAFYLTNGSSMDIQYTNNSGLAASGLTIGFGFTLYAR